MALLKFLRTMARQLPEKQRVRLRDAMLEHAWSRRLAERALQESVDIHILSFPKAGRTWLRLMLGHLLYAHYGMEADHEDLLELWKLNAQRPDAPLIRVTHDDEPHRKRPDELSTDKSAFESSKIVLLYRDIRDLLVSLYFENTRRLPSDLQSPDEQPSLEAFVRSERGGLDTVIRYYNIWAANRHVPVGFHLLRYEHLQADTAVQLREVVRFMGIDDVAEKRIREAVAFGRFDNMRQLEQIGAFRSPRMNPGNRDDPESYKTRRGRVGGYVDYMDDGLIEFVNDRLRTELADLYA